MSYETDDDEDFKVSWLSIPVMALCFVLFAGVYAWELVKDLMKGKR